MASLEAYKLNKLIGQGGDEWPEHLTITEIAKAHYPEPDKTDDAEYLQQQLQIAIDSGGIGISGAVVPKPDLSKLVQIVRLDGSGSNRPQRPEHTYSEWAGYFECVGIGSRKLFNLFPYPDGLVMASLKERFVNGWPKKWSLVVLNCETYIYDAEPLITSEAYEAWQGRPDDLPKDSLLKAWLNRRKRELEGQAESGDEGNNLTKLEKQHQAILEVINIKGFDPMQIPDGEKSTLEIICKADFPRLFDADSSFSNAWKKGHHLFKMANHASFARRGK